MDWDGRVVLVTGGSRGIGLATAKRFCDGGASVVIAGRSEEALAAAVAGLGHDERVRSIAADVGTVAGCYAAVVRAVTAFGRLDVVFTNAGSYESAPLGEVTEDMWDRTVDTHLKGTFFCVQAAAGAPEVRVNAVAPGPVGTDHLYADLSAAAYGGFEGAADAVQAVTQTLPLRRIIEPDEVARAVCFLAGLEAMTGSVLSVDAGTTIALP